MGCGCKGGGNTTIKLDGTKPKTVEGNKLTRFIENSGIKFMKIIGFLIGAIIISIIVIPFALYSLFKIMFIGDSLDIRNIMISISKRLIKQGDSDETDYSDINELDDIEEYELTGVEDITEEVKNK